jgi:hypothetical protein
MPRKKSAVEQRREQILKQVEHLRTRLATKSRRDYTSDFRYQTWLKLSHQLIDELLGELNELDEPGEYDALPVAVVSDELGLRLKDVRLLIRLGDIETTGRIAHERVSREELERLAALGAAELMRLSRQDAPAVFEETVVCLRRGDVCAAERSYRRVRARQSVIGTHALAAEIAIKLARGMYDEAQRVIGFVLMEKFDERSAVGTYLTEFLRGVCFKDPAAEASTFLLLKPLFAGDPDARARMGTAVSDLQSRAMYITAAIKRDIGDLVLRLPTNEREGVDRLLLNAVFSALYAEAHSHASINSGTYVLSIKQMIPPYWFPAQLHEELGED